MAPFDKKPNRKEAEEQKTKQVDDSPSIKGFIFFGLIGATATTILLKSRPYSSWTTGRTSSNHGTYSSNSWNRYNHRRMQEEYEDEMERLERIRRMQSVFNRERSKYKKTYESWRDTGPGAYQHFQRDDWYWKTDPSFKDRRTNFRSPTRDAGSFVLSHHYSILGLDRSRTKPYSDAEIKTAFRAKAMEYHPDQNQGNKEAAEAKFKEVMVSYEAIKSERKSERP